MPKRWLPLSALALLGGCSEVLGIEEGVEKGSTCSEEGIRACNGPQPRYCSEKRWINSQSEPCEFACTDGNCPQPTSCTLKSPCAGNISCCETLWVPGGDFQMRYDGGEFLSSFPRSVSGFFLDRFEVTVIRFRQFLKAYPREFPGVGGGAPPRHPELGWQPEWSARQEPDGSPAVPVTRELLEESLINCQGSTFAQDESTLPVNCVNWYIAFAFCAWDGGRLPTEAEWQFVASRGDEQRVYPWSSPPRSEFILKEHAWYGVDGPQPVGTRMMGQGGFYRDFRENAHDDLAGNVFEWVLDGDGTPDPMPCADCVTAWTTNGRVMRGGYYGNVSVFLKNAAEAGGEAESRSAAIGFRCARDAQSRLNEP